MIYDGRVVRRLRRVVHSAHPPTTDLPVFLRELEAQGRLSALARDAGLTHVPARAPFVQPEITLQSLREAAGG